jgi:hypothetical protein
MTFRLRRRALKSDSSSEAFMTYTGEEIGIKPGCIEISVALCDHRIAPLRASISAVVMEGPLAPERRTYVRLTSPDPAIEIFITPPSS